MGRRPRTGPPRPIGKSLVLSSFDDTRMLKLHQHGHLPTPYIFAFTKAERINYIATRNRLALLRHERSYLFLPKQQDRAPNSRSNFGIYGLNVKGEDYLKTKGLFSEFAPVVGDSDLWFHDFMASTVTASFDLATPKGYEYEPQNVVLERHGTHLSFPVPFIEPKTEREVTTDLKPDRVGQINYPNDKKLLTFIEVERSKKQHTYRVGHKTTERNCLQYFEFIGRRRYMEYFTDTAGLGAVVLFIYWDTGTMMGAIEHMRTVLPAGASQFMLFRSLPNFDIDNFKPPQVLDTLWTDPWLRVGHPSVKLTDL